MTPTYLIHINQKGTPVLVEVPEKPNKRFYAISEDEIYLHDICQYDLDVKTIIADESKHIHFRDADDVNFKMMLAMLLGGFVKAGQNFEIPEGYEITILEKLPPLALLTPSHPEKEAKEEVPPALKFSFDPNAEFTFDEWLEISQRKRPEDTKDNKAWAGAWLDGEMTGYAKCMVNRVFNSEKFTARELEIAFCVGMLNQKDLDIDKLSDQLSSGTPSSDKQETSTAEEIDFDNIKTPQYQAIAQWAVENRWPNDDESKIGDFEYFTEIAERIKKEIEEQLTSANARIKELEGQIEKERNEAVQECIHTMTNTAEWLSVENPFRIISELEKLKTHTKK